MSWYDSPLHNARDMEDYVRLSGGNVGKWRAWGEYKEKTYLLDTGCYVEGEWRSNDKPADQQIINAKKCDNYEVVMRCYLRKGIREIPCEQYENDPMGNYYEN
jgi:hypothetical protein